MAAAKPRVRNTVARGISRDLDTARLPPESLLRQAGLDRRMLKDEEGWLAYEAHARLIELVAEAFKDPYYGLKLANRMEPKEFGALAYIGLSSRTLEGALRNLERYLAIHTEASRIRLIMEGDAAVVAIVPARPDYSLYAQAAETGIGVLVKAYQYFLGQRLILLSQKVAGFLCEWPRILRRFVFSMRGLRWIFERAPVKNGLGCMSGGL